MAKNKYPHFDPSKHNVDVKMAKVRVSSHCKHNINYHIVFIPKLIKILKKLNYEGVSKGRKLNYSDRIYIISEDKI